MHVSFYEILVWGHKWGRNSASNCDVLFNYNNLKPIYE